MIDTIISMEERVLLIIKEFFEGIEEKEPFQMELMDLKLRFKAKLLEIITSYPTEPEIASRGLDYVLEGVERVIREEIEKVNLESEESLLRTMETLKAVGDVLKEFMHEDRVRDKRKLSSTVGFIGNSVEKLATEHKKRFGGIVRRIKKLFSI